MVHEFSSVKSNSNSRDCVTHLFINSDILKFLAKPSDITIRPLFEEDNQDNPATRILRCQWRVKMKKKELQSKKKNKKVKISILVNTKTIKRILLKKLFMI